MIKWHNGGTTWLYLERAKEIRAGGWECGAGEARCGDAARHISYPPPSAEQVIWFKVTQSPGIYSPVLTLAS